jgi:hypothetical protein
VLRLYLHAEEGIPEDMGVDTRLAMVVTLVATEDIMGVTPATSTDGSQAARRGVAIS